MRFGNVSLNSKKLANEGALCYFYDPRTMQRTGAWIKIRGADSDAYKAKQKEIQARHRSDGNPITAEMAEKDAKEILAACSLDWGEISDENTGDPVPFSTANVLVALEDDEAYRQLAEFAMNRSHFLAPALANYSSPSGQKPDSDSPQAETTQN